MRNQVPATIRAIESGGAVSKVSLDGPGGVRLTAVITNDAVEDLGLRVGQKVTALIKATEVVLMTS
jgi:molybdate transport system regulatory protein